MAKLTKENAARLAAVKAYRANLKNPKKKGSK